MSLGIRDLVATILAAATAGILYIQAYNVSAPMLGSNRLAAVILLVLGVAMCAVGNRPDTGTASKSNGMNVLMGVLGVLILVAAIWVLIAKTEVMVLAMGIIILAMWLITTLRHALTHRPQPVA